MCGNKLFYCIFLEYWSEEEDCKGIGAGEVVMGIFI